MNGESERQLKIIVERVVRPVRTGYGHKLRIRTELLQHLTGVFEEEWAKSGDAAEALRRAEERFGEPQEISRELERSISLWQRTNDWLNRRFEPRPGDSIVSAAARIAAQFFVMVFSLYMMVTALALVLSGKWELAGRTLRLMTSIAGAMSLLGFCLILVGWGLRRASFDNRRPLWQRGAMAGSLVVAAIFVTLTIFFGLYWLASGDSDGGWRGLRASWGAACLIPLVVVAVTNAWCEERRRENEWASLEIG